MNCLRFCADQFCSYNLITEVTIMLYAVQYAFLKSVFGLACRSSKIEVPSIDILFQINQDVFQNIVGNRSLSCTRTTCDNQVLPNAFADRGFLLLILFSEV